jgi:hypothetical protein
VVPIFCVVEFDVAPFGRVIGVVDAPAATVPKACHLFIPLFQLHPGVDEVILLLQQDEYFERIDDLFEFALIHIIYTQTISLNRKYSQLVSPSFPSDYRS